MSSSIDIIERIEDEFEAGKPVDVELRILNIGMICLQLDVRVEFAGAFLCDLWFVGLEHGLKRGLVARTKALDFLMCSWRKRNWRLRLLRSIVSRSTMWISPKPVRTRFFKSSQPIPPAPTITTRDCDRPVSVGQGDC